MPVLAVPAATASPIDHADWLELEALGAADRNSAMQDLATAVRRTGSAEQLEEEGRAEDTDDRGGETTEPIAEAAFAEIEDRATACDGLYPFELTSESIQASTGTQSSVYVFLLLLSRFGKDAGPAGVNAPQLFEEVAEVAIGNFLGGRSLGVETYQFGFPRRLTPSGFKDAVDDLCQRTGEGSASRDRPTRQDQKDAALDLIAWKPFPDRRRSMVMTWGQCATGANWDDKLTELAPSTWAGLWMTEQPSVPPIRSFFVPHRVGLNAWDVAAFKAGVLFDRCRIAAHAPSLPRDVRNACRRFSGHVLRERVRR